MDCEQPKVIGSHKLVDKRIHVPLPFCLQSDRCSVFRAHPPSRKGGQQEELSIRLWRTPNCEHLGVYKEAVHLHRVNTLGKCSVPLLSQCRERWTQQFTRDPYGRLGSTLTAMCGSDPETEDHGPRLRSTAPLLAQMDFQVEGRRH